MPIATQTIVRNSFIQMSKLPNVKGRISYISSKARQENLYAVYETTDRKFWTELAKCNQEEFRKSGTDGNCIEARELLIGKVLKMASQKADKGTEAAVKAEPEQRGFLRRSSVKSCRSRQNS